MISPSISSASYDAATGLLTLTGTNLSLTPGKYQVSDFKLSGDSGLWYQLSNTSKVSATPTASSVQIQLSTADQLAVDGLLNKDGTQANDGTSSYILKAAAGWESGATASIIPNLTVSNVTPPSLNTVNYNAASGIFSFTGTNLSNQGSLNGLKISDFTMTGGSGSFNLTSHDLVSKLSATGFSVTLSSVDKAQVNSFVTLNGSSPLTGNAYTLNATSHWDSDNGLAISNLAVTASGIAPLVSGASYNALNGQLTVFGSDFNTLPSAFQLKDLSLLGYAGGKYQLSSGSSIYGAIGNNQLIIKLSAADQLAVNGLLNADGTLASDGHSHYALSAGNGWDGGNNSIKNLAVTVTQTTPPTLSAAVYNASSGMFAFSGSQLTNLGSKNGIILSDIKFTVAGYGSFSFNNNDTVSYLTANTFNITLSAADKNQLNKLANANGDSSLSNIAYNLTVSDNWDSHTGSAISQLAVTVKNVAPLLSAVSYDATAGILTLSGKFPTPNAGDFTPIALTLKGETGYSYTMTSGSAVTGTPSTTSVAIQLSNVDHLAIDGLLDKNGTAALDGTTYSISAASGWDLGASTATSKPVSVSNAYSPTLSSISYNTTSGVFSFTGSNLSNHGYYMGLAPENFTISVTGKGSYSLNPYYDQMNNFNSQGFNITLNSVDKALVNSLLNDNGSNSLNGSAYKLNVQAGWDSNSGANTSKTVVVSGFSPTISHIGYDAATGILSLNGSNLPPLASSFIASDLTITGEKGGSYTLTSGSAATSALSTTAINIQLSAADQLAVDGLLNQNGNTAQDGSTTYNLYTLKGWDSGTDILNKLPISVSNAAIPTLTAVNYNAASGVFSFSGTNLSNLGNQNGIQLNQLLLNSGNNSFTFNSSDTISNLTADGFDIKLGNTDYQTVKAFLNANGNLAQNGAAYDLTATAGWDSHVGAAISNLPLSVNSLPVVNSVSYDAATGILTINGNNFTTTSGDYNPAAFVIQGDGGGSYALTGSSSFTGNPTSNTLSIQLSASDELAINGLLNNNGTMAINGNAYQLKLNNGWDSFASAQTVSAVTVNNVAAPTLSAVSYNATSGVFSFSGSNLDNHGTSNGIALNNFTLSDDAGSYTFKAGNDLQSSLTATGFTLTLNSADRAAANSLLNANGYTAQDGAAYHLAVNANWDSNAGAALSALPVNVSGIAGISSVSYNASTGLLTLNGNNLDSVAGNYQPADLTILGDGGNSYSLSSGSAVSGTPSSTTVSILLSATDQLAVNGLLNNNGTQAENGIIYNLSASRGWETSAPAFSSQAISVNSTSQPLLSAVSYNTVNGVFSFTGSNLVNHGTVIGINPADLTLSVGSKNYTFNTADAITNLTASSFTVTLSSADQTLVDALITANGSLNQSGTAYNIAASNGWDTDSSQVINSLAVTASGLPAISSASYDASSGQLSLTCTNLTSYINNYTLADFTISGDGSSYALTGGTLSGNPSIGNLIIQLTASDQLAVDGLLNANGTIANNGSHYNLAVSNGWDTHAIASSTLPITVSNITEPTLSAVSYNANSGIFTFTGSNLVYAGANNGILQSALRLSAGSSGFSFNSSDIVGNQTGNGFSITLSNQDKTLVNALTTANGSNTLSGAAYDLAVANHWDSNSGQAISTLPVVVSGVTPVISGVTYNAATGILSLSGSDLSTTTTNYLVSDLSLTGDGKSAYTLTSGSQISGTPTASLLNIQLSATDQLAVDGLLNHNGSTANDNSTSYVLAAASGWDSGNNSFSRGITVSQVTTPALSAVSYNAVSGVFTFSGSNLSNHGSSNGINPAFLTLSDKNGSFVFNSSDTVNQLSANGFSISLSAGDKTVVNSFVNANGSSSQNGSLYNLSSLANWNSDSGTAIASQTVTVTGLTPKISNIEYYAASGVLSLTGSNLSPLSSSYLPNALTLSGDAAGSYTLTSASTVIGLQNGNTLNIQLSAVDQVAVDGLLNRNGNTANDGLSQYGLSAAAGWDAGTDSFSGQALSVSNVITPQLSTVTYNASIGSFSFTGSNLVNHGSVNGINLSNFSLSSGSQIFSFNPVTDSVSNLTATGFSINLGSADSTAVNAIATANGTTALSGASYNLAISHNWDSDSGAASSTQAVTVTGIPTLNSVTYNAASGILTLAGNNLNTQPNHYAANDLTLSGDGGIAYTLSSGSLVNGTPGSNSVAFQLSTSDELALNGLLNLNGTTANSGNSYQLSAAKGWDGSGYAISNQGITVSNVTAPSLSAVSYNAASGILTVSGQNLTDHGSAKGITVSDFTLSSGSNSYSFSNNDTVNNISASGFSISLSNTDRNTVNAFINADGVNALTGKAYNFAAAANWDSNSGAAVQTQAISVSGVPTLNTVGYNAASGILTLTGSYLTTNSGDYHVSDFSFSGDGGNSFKLSNGSGLAAAPTNSNSLSIQLSTYDQIQLNGLLNNNGSKANDGSSYALTASSGWDSNSAAISSLAVTVNNVSPPVLTAVSYNASNGTLSFTGSNLVTAGSSLGIKLNDFTLSIAGNNVSLNTAYDSISNLSSNGFTVTLAINELNNINRNLLNIYNNQAYTLGITANWDSDAGTAQAAMPISISNIPEQTLINATLNMPNNVAVNNAGYVFIADTNNGAVKVITASGLTTVFSGLNKPTAIAFDANYNLYMLNSGNNMVLEEKTGSNSASAIASKGLSNPGDITVYNGNVYIADSGNNAIKEVVPGNLTPSKVLTYGLHNPQGIAFDNNGNLYIADSGDNAIKELLASNNTLTTLLSTGVSNPGGIAVDSHGNIFFSDSGNNAIKEIVAGTNTAITLVSSGLKDPMGIALDSSGNLYVTDTGNNAVKELVHTSYIFNTAPTADSVQTINNFWENTGQIHLSTAVFTALANQANVTAANFSNAAIPTSSTDYLFYNASNGGVYYDATGSVGKLAAVEIAVIGTSSHPAALTANDFTLVA